MRKITSFFVLVSFVCSCVMPPHGLAQSLSAVGLMPQPGTMVNLTPACTPAHLWGMAIHPDAPFKFDFLIQRGDARLAEDSKRAEYTRLVKYFLAALAVPDADQWVNLSPYEKDRIIPDTFGLTEMGRDLLAQDYFLKQLASSLTSPDTRLGKKFWDDVYAEAYRRFGTTNVPTDIFNKVWIMPGKAVVFEKANTVYVLESHLKVMTEKDYLALKNNATGTETADAEAVTDISSRVMKDVIIPAIEKEVNEGQSFAPLRQVYSGVLLATWYKRALKGSILGKLYADRSKVKGVDQQDPRANRAIYDRYVQAFQKGVFNMIREEVDKNTQEVIPRKYFSGGTAMGNTPIEPAQDALIAGRQIAVKAPDTDVVETDFATAAVPPTLTQFSDVTAEAYSQLVDAAMQAGKLNLVIGLIVAGLVAFGWLKVSDPNMEKARSWLVEFEKRVVLLHQTPATSLANLGRKVTSLRLKNGDVINVEDLRSFMVEGIEVKGVVHNIWIKDDQCFIEMDNGTSLLITGPVTGDAWRRARTRDFAQLMDAAMTTKDVVLAAATIMALLTSRDVLALPSASVPDKTRARWGASGFEKQGAGNAVQAFLFVTHFRLKDGYEVKVGQKIMVGSEVNKVDAVVEGIYKAKNEPAYIIQVKTSAGDTFTFQVDGDRAMETPREKAISAGKGIRLKFLDILRGTGSRYKKQEDIRALETKLDEAIKEYSRSATVVEVLNPLSALRVALSNASDGLLIKYDEKVKDAEQKAGQIDFAETKPVDKASVNGGIDFAASNLDMQIKRDGAGVPLPVGQQDLDNIHIDGLVPVIVNIRPAEPATL